MKKAFLILQVYFFTPVLLISFSCRQKNTSPSLSTIQDMNLKRGKVLTCGSADRKLGDVQFEISAGSKVKEDFNLALELLHSFEYDEAEKVFARIIDIEPEFTMAYWGVAMSNFHPLWTPPSEAELKKGAKAIEIAQSISKKSKREEAYINAITTYYKNWTNTDHYTRCQRFEHAMEKLQNEYPRDKEAAIFYALALNAAANPKDKSFKKQKKAGAILNALYPNQPDHPGIVHYIIHTYDYPGLAERALHAARKYASIAPSSSHALHMPSHIFIRLGLWEESIQSNLASVSSSQCYAEAAGIKGHWDEELHALDYLMYSYLQKGENALAKRQWDYLQTIKEVSPLNFKVAYAFAAIPSRYVLENKLWKEAAALKMYPEIFPWKDFPWQKCIIHFTRVMGACHLGNTKLAKKELQEMKVLHDVLTNQKDLYKADQVQIQINTGEAWLRLEEGKREEALKLINSAADMEDKTGKHPVTPGEVLPARELLADLYMRMEHWDKALIEYKATLKNSPNRFNALYGAGKAAENSGNSKEALFYYRKLISIAGDKKSPRPELIKIREFLARES